MINYKIDQLSSLIVKLKYYECFNRRNFSSWVLSVSVFVLLSCQSPEDEANNHINKSKDLFKQGDIAGAKQELKNASQAGLSISDTYFYMALLNEKSGDNESMRANLQKTLLIDPGNYQARVALGRVLLYFNDIDGVLLQAGRVLEHESENPEALLLKATAQFRQQKLGEALSIVDDVLTEDPENTKAILLKVKILMENENFDEALNIIDTAIHKHPDNLSLYLLKIELDIKREDMNAVISDYKKLLQIYPESQEFTYSLAEIYIHEKRSDEAEKLFLKLIAENPENQSHKLSLLTFLKNQDEAKLQPQIQEFLVQYKEQPKVLIQFSEWLIENEESTNAEKTLQHIITLESNSSLGFSAQILLANLALQSNNPGSSLNIVNTVLKNKPDYHDAVVLKGRLLLLQKEPNKVIALLSAFLLSKPRSDAALVLLAKAYALKGDNVMAEKYYSQAFVMNPGNLQASIAEYDRAMNNNNFRNANKILEKALGVQPDSVELLHSLAMIRIAENNWDGALEIVNELEQRHDAKIQASLLRGKILEQQGRYLKAIEIYKRILKTTPNNADALNAIVNCYEALDNRQDILVYLTLYIEENPLNISAYILKSRLYHLENKPSDAINIINQAISIDNKNAKTYEQLASIYLATGNKPKELATYKLGLRNIPGDINLSLLLASFYERDGEHKQAVSIYENLIELDLRLDIAVSKLAFILTDQYGDEGSLKRAKLLTRRFKNLDQPILSDTYAWVELKSGNVRRVLKIFKKNVLVIPDVAIFKYHLGVAYYQVGKNGFAMAELQQAINLSKTQEFFEVASARKLLAEIKEAR